MDGKPAGGKPGVEESPRERTRREARERAEKARKEREAAEKAERDAQKDDADQSNETEQGAKEAKQKIDDESGKLSPREKRKQQNRERAANARKEREARQNPDKAAKEAEDKLEPTGNTAAVDDLWKAMDDLEQPSGFSSGEVSSKNFTPEKYAVLRDRLSAVIREMSPTRIPDEDVSDALMDYLFPDDETYNQRWPKLEPYFEQYMQDFSAGKVNPWADIEAEPAAEAAPAEEQIPEPPKEEPVVEKKAPMPKGWGSLLDGIIGRINTMGEGIPPAFAGAWNKKRVNFDQAIEDLQRDLERLDFQDRLHKSTSRTGFGFGFNDSTGTYQTMRGKSYYDLLRQVSEMSDEEIMVTTEAFAAWVDNNARTRLGYDYLRDREYQKTFGVKDPKTVYLIRPASDTLVQFAKNRLRINNEKRKTPPRNVLEIERNFERMLKRVTAKGPAMKNPKSEGFITDLRDALNKPYDEFIKRIDEIAKEMKKTTLPKYDLQKRLNELKDLKAQKRYDELRGVVEMELAAIPDEHEKKSGFEKRYDRITSERNRDPMQIKTVDLETLLFQMERRDDKYVEPDPLVDYQSTSQIDTVGGVSIGAKMPNGQWPGWKAHMDSFSGVLEEMGLTIDDYVVQKLGYDGIEEIVQGGYLSSEQIDAVANIIRTIDTDGAFILADQTGVGKGRQQAAGMAYAVRQGFPVVFMTEKPNLFGNMIDDLTDIGMRKRDENGNPVPGRFITYGIINSGIIDRETIIDGKPLQGVAKSSAETTKMLEAAAENWDSFPFDIMMLTYSQLNARDLTKPTKWKTERDGVVKSLIARVQDFPLARRRVEALRQLSTNSVMFLDESHEAASEDDDSSILTRADKKGLSMSEVFMSRGGAMRDVVSRARSVVFSSATFAKRPDNLDIYALRTNMWRSIVGVRDDRGALVTLSSLFRRGGVALQQIFSAMLSRDGGIVRRQRSMSDAIFKDLEINVPTETVDDLAKSFSSLADFSIKIMQPHYDKMKAAIEKTVDKKIKVDINYGDFPSLMHNFTDLAYAALTVDKNAAHAIDLLKNGEKAIVTFANTGASMLTDFIETYGHEIGDEFEFTMADVAKAYLRKALRYRVSLTKRGRQVGEDPVYRFVDPMKDLTSEGAKAYLETQKLLTELLQGYIGSPFDYAKARIEEAGFEVGEITGRSMYLEEIQGTKKFKLKSRTKKGPEHNRQVVRRFNGGLINDENPIPDSQWLHAVIMNKSGAVGTSMHASEKFADQRRRNMIVAQGEKDINLYIQILGRIDRTGQLLERTLPDGTVVPNNPTYHIPKTTVPGEARMRAVLNKKLEMLNANLSAAGLETNAEGEEEVTDEQIVSPIGAWAVAQVLRENDKWRSKILIAPEAVENEDKDALDYDPGLAGKATKNIALLPYADQIRFYEEVIDAYRAEAQRRRMHGENVGSMDVQDIRAVGRRSMILDPAVGATQFESSINAVQVTAEYTNSPIFIDKVLGEAVNVLKEQGYTTEIDPVQKPLTALRNAGATKVGDEIRAADELIKEIEKEIDDDTELTGDQKQSKKDAMQKSRNYLMHGDKNALSGMNGVLNHFHIGNAVQLYIDGDWHVAVVTNILRKKSQNPFSPTAWKVDMIVANPHKPVYRAFAMSNFINYNGEVVDGRTNYKPLDAAIGNLEMDVNMAFEAVRRKVQEGVEQRIVITGNIIRAFAKYGEANGTLTQITDPTGNIGAAYLLSPQYTDLEQVKRFSMQLENGHEIYEFIKAVHEDKKNPSIPFHPNADVYTYLTNKDDNGNELEYGKDLILNVPAEGMRLYSLKSKFASKEFLAFVNGVKTSEIEGRDAVGPNPISSVKYHFVVKKVGNKTQYQMRIPFRMDTREETTRALQWWRNNTNPDNIKPKVDGSRPVADDYITKTKNLSGASIKTWPANVSVLSERQDMSKPMPLFYNKDIPFEYDPEKGTPFDVKTQAERWVEFLERKSGASVLAAAMAKNFIDYGSTALIGLKAENTDDIAIIGQAMRHPMFEKMNAFIIKDGAVIDYFSVSNRLPGSTTINGADSLRDAIKASMAAHKADGFYLTHNHPGGDPTPSGGVNLFGQIGGDRGATIYIASNIEGFLGHIVLDEDHYGVVPPTDMNPVEKMRALNMVPTEFGYVRPLPKVVVENPGRWSYKNPLRADASVKEILETGPVNGEHFTSADIEQLVAGSAKKIIDPKNTFVLIGTSAASAVSGITTVPIAVLEQANTPRGELKLAAWLRKFHYLTSSNEVYAYGVPAAYKELIQKAMDTGLLAGAMDADATLMKMEYPQKAKGTFGRENPPTWLIRKGNKWERLQNDKGTTTTEVASSPRAAADVRREVEGILGADSSMMKSGRLRVVQSDADLPGHLRRENGAVAGVVDNMTKRVYIVADNAGENARGIALHEIGVHVGLKTMLGDKFTEVLRQMRGLLAVKNPAAVEAYARVPDDVAPENRDEEALGYLVENAAAREMGIVTKVLTAIRAWAFKNGLVVKNLTPEDMLAMAAAAARSAGRQDQTSQYLDEEGNVDPIASDSDIPPSYSVMQTVKDKVREKRRKNIPTSPYFAQNEKIREKDKTLWSKVKKELQRQFAPGGLLPESVFKSKIWRDNKFAVTELDVTAILAHYEKAVREEYGMAPEDLDPVTTAKLNDALAGGSLEGIPEKVKVQIVAMNQMITGYSEEYGAILFDEIARLKADNKNEAAAARAALLETINANLGKYAHRSYRAFDDAKWATRVPDDVLDRARAYLTTQAEEQAAVYDEWADKAERRGEYDKAQRHRDYAEKLRNPERIEGLIQYILKTGKAFDNLESFIKEAKLGAKDLTILMRRKKIPKEIRALLGEYIDPRINFAKTVTKQGRLIWNQRFLNRVLEQGLGVFLFEEKDRPSEARVQLAGVGSKAYSPLDGYWTTPEVAQAFQEALGPGKMDGWYQTIVKWNGLVKYGKTVLSPTTAFRNWMSAAFFALANAHFNFGHMSKSMASFKEYFTDMGDGIAYLRKLKGLGVVYDTPYAGEMMRLLKESQIEDLLVGKSLMPGKKFLDLATKFYSFGDDFWKILGFENEVDLLMKHKKMSREEAEVVAAERIRNTYPTYSMTGRAVNTLRRFPLAGTFVSFPSEIIRTSYHILNYLKQDMADPDLRPLAMRRIVGLSMASGMAYAAQVMFMAMLGVDDDEEEAFRDLAAPWQKNSNIIPISRDENGNLRFIDVSFLDPYNYWKRPINAIMRDQPFEELVMEIGREVFAPFFGTDIAAGALMEVLTNKRETGGRVFNPQDTVPNQTMDIANHLRKAVQPGFMSNFERMADALSGKVSPSGKRYEMSDEMLAFMGFRISTHDPRAALYYKSFEFRDMKKDATSIMTAVARDPNAVSEGELLSAYERAMVVRSRAYIEMERLVAAARASGMDDMKLRQVLSQSGISRQDVNSLIRGEVPAYKPSKGYLKQAVNKARLLFPQRAPEIEARRKLLTEQSK